MLRSQEKLPQLMRARQLGMSFEGVVPQAQRREIRLAKRPLEVLRLRILLSYFQRVPEVHLQQY